MIIKEAVMFRSLVCIVSLLLVLSTSTFVPATDTIESLLPSPTFSEGWVMEGKVTTYTADTLYLYINGESELYFPYGFEIVGTAIYANKNNPKIGLVADVYKMGSLLDAFGIYSNYRKPTSEQVKIGGEGFVTESQLMFYQDRFFVRLYASGTTSLEKTIFLSCAEAIKKRLPGTSSHPKELDLLKITHVSPRTEKYLAQSALGYGFFKKGLIADATLDGEPVRVFVILHDSMNDSTKTLDNYINYLEESGVKPKPGKEIHEVTFITHDPLYKGVMIRQVNRYLLGVANLKDPSKATPLIDRLQSRITAP